jgi:hypothetical protein
MREGRRERERIVPQTDANRFLVEKPEGNEPIGRPRRRWEDNIRVDLRETGWGGMD